MTIVLKQFYNFITQRHLDLPSHILKLALSIPLASIDDYRSSTGNRLGQIRPVYPLALY